MAAYHLDYWVGLCGNRTEEDAFWVGCSLLFFYILLLSFSVSGQRDERILDNKQRGNVLLFFNIYSAVEDQG